MRRGKIARETRHEKAQTLKEQRNSRSIKEQLSILAKRPGASTKERTRLLALIKKQNN